LHNTIPKKVSLVETEGATIANKLVENSKKIFVVA